MKWNFFIRLGLEIYLEMTVLSLLNLDGIDFQDSFSRLSSFVSLLIALIIFVFTFWIPTFILRNVAKIVLGGATFFPNTWAIVDEFKFKSKIALLYNFFFVVRRFLYAIILVFLTEYPTI